MRGPANLAALLALGLLLGSVSAAPKSEDSDSHNHLPEFSPLGRTTGPQVPTGGGKNFTGNVVSSINDVDLEHILDVLKIAGPLIVGAMGCISVCTCFIAVAICVRVVKRSSYQRLDPHQLDDEELAYQDRVSRVEMQKMNKKDKHKQEIEDIFGADDDDDDDVNLEFDAHELEQMQNLEVLHRTPNAPPAPPRAAESMGGVSLAPPPESTSTPVGGGVRARGDSNSHSSLMPRVAGSAGGAGGPAVAAATSAITRLQEQHATMQGGGWKDSNDDDLNYADGDEYELGEEFDHGSAAGSNLSFEMDDEP